MKTESHSEALVPSQASGSEGTTLTQRLVLSRMARITSGTLTVAEGGRVHELGRADETLLSAVIQVHDVRFWKAIAYRGSIGSGEAYAKGWWSSPEPADVVRIFVRNQDVLEGMERGLARLSRPLFALYHALRRNSEKGSRENISAHYDVSNDFFALFLDDTMTYSCGIFENEESTMRDASIAKIDHLCHKLDLRPTDHLLEIGTGWGAFAIHAAREYGCRVTTTTISKEQHDFAAQRIREAGLEDRITLHLQDYRKLEGQFDKLVSVEMIEAVGAQYYPVFFRRCSELLKPGGTMALQAITIADQYYESARRSVDFIQRHIFPGSCIPSVTALSSAMTKAGDLRIVDLEDIGAHYVKTLATWRANLFVKWSEARAMGYSDEFLRLWEFYFAYCEGGFAERHIGNVHMLLQRPGTPPPRSLRAPSA
ncbi:MAG: cyclopropane-fatty-acyl-phospholipid synthase [Planctomycetota bacterium]|jgi:cyclopropane-fatty-acyl-phospholipid synthase